MFEIKTLRNAEKYLKSGRTVFLQFRRKQEEQINGQPEPPASFWFDGFARILTDFPYERGKHLHVSNLTISNISKSFVLGKEGWFNVLNETDKIFVLLPDDEENS
jgi:hypothetical protein